MAYTQTDIVNMTTTLVDHEVRLSVIATHLRRQGDPEAFYREHEIMMLQNCIYTLRGYIVSDAILDEIDIRVPYEIGLQISLNWPRS